MSLHPVRTVLFILSLACALTSAACGQQPSGDSERPTTQPEDEPALDYTHPLGVGFDLPEGWRVEEVPQGLRLHPTDPARGPQGDAEIHLVGMIGADPSVRSLDDRRVPGLVLQLVQTQLPFVRASQAPHAIEGRDDLRVFTFTGRSPLGQQVECRVHGLLQDGWFVAFTAAAEPAQLAKREAAMTRVATRLCIEAPRAERDDVVGTWYAQAMSSAGGIRDRLHVSTTTRIQVGAHGLLFSGSQSTVVGQDQLGGSVTGLTDESRSAGRWARVGSEFYAVWRQGGAGRYRVHLQGSPGRREMLLTPVAAGGGSKLLWTEYRM